MTKFNYFLWTLIALALPVTAYFLISSAIMSPIATAIGLVFAVPYAAFYLWLFRRNSAWLEGKAWLWASLLWGAGISLVIALAAGAPWVGLTQDLGWEMFMASFGGGYPEEIAKAVGVFFLLMSYGSRPWHGFILGAMVGLGFEVIENIMYGATGAVMHVDSDIHGAVSTWALRTFIGPGLHVMFSAIAGFGIGWAVFGQFRGGKRILIGAGSVLTAFLLHFGWNTLHSSVAAQIISYLVVGGIGYPLVIWMYIRTNQEAKNHELRPSAPIQSLKDLQQFRARVYPVKPKQQSR